MEHLAIQEEVSQPYPVSVRLVDVKIRDCGEVKKLDSGQADLRCGDRVLLEADGEVTYGVVYAAPYLAPFVPPMRVMKSIMRKATQEDVALIARLERLSHEATAYCRAKAAAFNLQLKLVEVYGALQSRQLTFVYTADERIDFRDLVRDLARRFGGRIEMRQVGVREEARRLGGIDTCGLVLCCASFLTEVKPVTVKQARHLGLPVDDPRLLGVCGRLKCCLMFEAMETQASQSNPRGLITPTKSSPRVPPGVPA
jgi:cell fate regulator YaaT (PSP1 superfamily)